MKTQGVRVMVAIGLAALVLGVATLSAQAGDRPGLEISFDLDNFDPTPVDEIGITVHYALPDGCYDVDEGQPVQISHEITVRIDATEVPGPCPGPTDETIHRVIGPLDAGEYDIGAQVNIDYLCQGPLCESESSGLWATVRVADVGDANCDGSIDSIDASVVLQQSAALTFAACQQGADANTDGQVQSTDAALILQFSAGLLDQLPPDQ